jgi:hypothetical protein
MRRFYFLGCVFDRRSLGCSLRLFLLRLFGFLVAAKLTFCHDDSPCRARPWRSWHLWAAAALAFPKQSGDTFAPLRDLPTMDQQTGADDHANAASARQEFYRGVAGLMPPEEQRCA